MRKVLFILNPSSGRGMTGDWRAGLRRRFGDAGMACTFHETAPGEDTGVFVHDSLRQHFDLVVAAGGDGTIAAVIDGLTGSNVPLGIVPMGTGNLVARELDIPIDPDQAVALLTGTHRRRAIDVMRINGRAFLLNASVGVSAAVIGSTSQREKKSFGRIAYIVRAIPLILRFRRRRLTVIVDDDAQLLHTAEVAVLNCGRLAGSIYPRAADVQADDGCLDVWVLRVKTLADCLWYLIRNAAGNHDRRQAQHLRARRRVVIQCATPQPVQADGDIIGTTPVTVEILPGALTVLVPSPPG